MGILGGNEELFCLWIVKDDDGASVEPDLLQPKVICFYSSASLSFASLFGVAPFVLSIVLW